MLLSTQYGCCREGAIQEVHVVRRASFAYAVKFETSEGKWRPRRVPDFPLWQVDHIAILKTDWLAHARPAFA
jgi:hypothetical protein